MVLGERDRFETEVLGHPRQLDDLVEHLLPALGSVGDRPLAATVLEGGGKRGKREVHEFHGEPPLCETILRRVRVFFMPIVLQRLPVKKRPRRRSGWLHRKPGSTPILPLVVCSALGSRLCRSASTLG